MLCAIVNLCEIVVLLNLNVSKLQYVHIYDKIINSSERCKFLTC